MRTLTPHEASYLALLAQYPHDNPVTRRIIQKQHNPFVRRVMKLLIGKAIRPRPTVEELGTLQGLREWVNSLGTVHAPPHKRR